MRKCYLMGKMFKQIDETIIIDFKLPNALKLITEEIEQANLYDDYGTFINKVSSLDNITKDSIHNKAITMEQRKTLLKRYDTGW